MRARILALLLLLGGASQSYAQCNPVIGVSNWNACAIATDNTLDCWGSDTFTLTSGAPAGTFTSLDGGDASMCAVETDGSLSCWGDSGQPILTEVPAGTTYTYVSPTTDVACARKSDNSVVCWGNNREACAVNADCVDVSGPCSAGQCDGAYGFDAPGSSFLQFSGDENTFCGVKTDNSLECWGYDWGNGVMTEPAGTNYDQVDAAADHACAIETDDTLTCWGDNTSGQSTAPAGTFADISVVNGTSCGVKLDGSLACWGSDAVDLLTDKPSTGSYAKIEGSAGVMCAVTTAGDVVCWGDDFATVVTASAGAECPIVVPPEPPAVSANYVVTFVGS